MSDRFVVEAGRRIVGLAVRVPGGFRFFASDPEFTSLEAKTFKHARSVVQRAAQFARSLGRQGSAWGRGPALH